MSLDSVSGWGPVPYTLDQLRDEFAHTCAVAWDVGLQVNGRPGRVTSVTLPEGVLPLLSKLQSPMDKSMVPIVRVPLCSVEYPKVMDDEAAGEQPPA